MEPQNVNEYAVKILSDHGCNEHSYYGIPAEEIIDELKEAYPEGMDFPYDQVANAIIEYSRPKTEEIPQEGFDFSDWGSWGVGDFYEGNLDELKDAFETNKPFNTGWHGFKKELQSMRIIRGFDEILVSCGAYMDSAFEDAALIYDCLENGEEEMLTDEQIDEIRNYLALSDFVEETNEEATLPVDATMDQVLEKASELMDDIQERLNDSFKECIATTLTVLYGPSEETNKMIEERIEKYQ